MLILLAHLFHYSDFVLLPGPVRRVEFSETSERKQIFIILFEFVLGTHSADGLRYCHAGRYSSLYFVWKLVVLDLFLEPQVYPRNLEKKSL